MASSPDLLNSSEAILDLYVGIAPGAIRSIRNCATIAAISVSDKFWFAEHSVYGRRLRKRLRVVTGLELPAPERVEAWMAMRYPNDIASPSVGMAGRERSVAVVLYRLRRRCRRRPPRENQQTSGSAPRFTSGRP